MQCMTLPRAVLGADVTRVPTQPAPQAPASRAVSRRTTINRTTYLVGARRRDGAPGGSPCKKEPRPWGQPHRSKEAAEPEGSAAG